MVSALSKIVKSNKIQVVGIYEDSDSLKIHVITLKKEKNKLSILDRNYHESFESFEKSLNTSLPLIVCYDGKKVLNKKVNLTSEVDLNWNKNLDLNSIYYTKHNTQSNIFISICRKDIVNFWIEKLLSSKFQVVDFYIGPLTSFILSSAINKETIISNKTELVVRNSELFQLDKVELFEDQVYNIGDSNLNNFEITIYGAGLIYFTDNLDFEKSTIANLNQEEIIYKKAFNYFGVFTLILFFTSLLLSYFLIQFYLSKNAELSVENLYSNKSYQEIISLESQLKEKEELINKSGFLSKQFLSFYSFEIINSLPSSMGLNEFNINPLSKDVKENKSIEFIPYQIILKGITKDEEEFNNWIKESRNKKWLKRIEIKSIKTDKKNNTMFELVITID
jgi:hypothetical protein